MATQNNDGRGEVQNPDTDGRLKENRGGGQQASGRSGDDDRESGGQGRVKDPDQDGRLKENR